jgi:hypothetical protein
METIMRRVIVIAAASILVGGCAEFSLTKFEIPNLSMPSLTPPAPTTTLEFESEPAGAEVRTSTGQTCRTPCSLAVQATELTATFNLTGYQPQTIPVKMVQPTEGIDPMTGQSVPPRLSPNPVYAELVAMAPPRRPAPPPAKPAPKQKPKTAAPAKPPAAPASAAPASAPASPWPAPQQQPPQR